MLKAITAALNALAGFFDLRALQVQQEMNDAKERKEEIARLLADLSKAIDEGDTTRISLLRQRLSAVKHYR